MKIPASLIGRLIGYVVLLLAAFGASWLLCSFIFWNAWVSSWTEWERTALVGDAVLLLGLRWCVLNLTVTNEPE